MWENKGRPFLSKKKPRTPSLSEGIHVRGALRVKIMFKSDWHVNIV